MPTQTQEKFIQLIKEIEPYLKQILAANHRKYE